MKRETAFALFVGFIMVFSVAGFALNSAIRQNSSQNQGFSIPTIVTRQLTFDETRYLLVNEGKIIFEFSYDENCTDCMERIAYLESFAQRMSDFVVLQEVKANETSVQIVGSGGKITDISNVTLTDNSLMEIFCDAAIAQPPECLMNEI